jgi:ubiquinone/menaquinone biosynthesis C-methylase UbiE
MHSPHIDLAFGLECLPWPLEDSSVAHLLALDVFEHLKCDVVVWLDECRRVLEPGGTLEFRVPQYTNPYSWRDPTHYRVFHKESFYYWCPNAPGTVWQNFGRYYFGEHYTHWWTWQGVRVDQKDLRFTLCKPTA